MIIQIGEPNIPVLTPVQKRIKELLDDGKSLMQIAYAVRMVQKYVREEIFEIRKWESFMGRGKLDNEKRIEIYNEWKNGTTQKKLAEQYGVSLKTINKIIVNLNRAKPAQINQEFEDAVDQMIEEHENSANAEKTFENAKENSENAESEPESLPDCVINAVRFRLRDLEEEIRMRKERIAELQQEITDLCLEYDDLNQWRDKWA